MCAPSRSRSYFHSFATYPTGMCSFLCVIDSDLRSVLFSACFDCSFWVNNFLHSCLKAALKMYFMSCCFLDVIFNLPYYTTNSARFLIKLKRWAQNMRFSEIVDFRRVVFGKLSRPDARLVLAVIVYLEGICDVINKVVCWNHTVWERFPVRNHFGVEFASGC